MNDTLLHQILEAWIRDVDQPEIQELVDQDGNGHIVQIKDQEIIIRRTE